jgi:RNA polymerase sigma factor (sigma-70 family)
MNTIARREAARWRTGPQGRAWAASAEQVPEPAVAAPELHDALDVRRALAELPERDRALVALRYHGDLTQAEIARLTGIPEGTVKVRLHRARTKLRAQLS